MAGFAGHPRFFIIKKDVDVFKKGVDARDKRGHDGGGLGYSE